MAVAKKDLVKGGIYITATEQLRKITKLEGDHVQYQSKSGKIRNREWNWGTTKSRPPSTEKFCKDVDRKLTKQETNKFIADGVLTREDLK